MRRFFLFLLSTSLGLYHQTSLAKLRYGEALCKKRDYSCLKVRLGQSWDNLFSNDGERDIVRRINRMNVRLQAGMVIAIPKNLESATIYDHSPFPRHIDSVVEKTIYVSQIKLAWGAYDESGELLWWGPISTGANTCSDVSGSCQTPGGKFRIMRKQGIDCVSTTFPQHFDGISGGAPMPYCMHFFRGYALHGSKNVPGYRASHGCVRLFPEDARWLNEEFIDLPYSGLKGTQVIIEPTS